MYPGQMQFTRICRLAKSRRQIASEGDHRRFRAGVGNGIREGVSRMNRADIYDAGARLRENGKQFFGQEEGAAQVHVHHQIPIGNSESVQRLVELNARIVHQYVNVVVKLLNGVHRVLNLSRLCQVDWHEPDRQRMNCAQSTRLQYWWRPCYHSPV